VLFEDFAQYFTQRKPQGQRCFLIVDEFSALAQTGQMASRVEQARGYQTGLILAPQTTAGMGGPEQAARILGSAETIICHRISTPEDIVALAGTRLTPERSLAYNPDGATGDGSIRVQHQYRVANDVRRLPTGQAWVIARGQAMKLAIRAAPTVSEQLPPDEEHNPTAAPTSTQQTGTRSPDPIATNHADHQQPSPISPRDRAGSCGLGTRQGCPCGAACGRA